MGQTAKFWTPRIFQPATRFSRCICAIVCMKSSLSRSYELRNFRFLTSVFWFVAKVSGEFHLDRNRGRTRTGLQLGVDPFFPGVPPLIYSWHIQATLRQTAPFIETSLNSGGKMQMRDESRLGYEEIPETNAWTDDGARPNRHGSANCWTFLRNGKSLRGAKLYLSFLPL